MNLKKITLFFKKNINYLIIIAIFIVVFSTSFGTSFLEMMRLVKLKHDLTNQIAESEEISSQLDDEIAQIGTQSYIERIARQYLELYYPNEQIVIPVENSLKDQAQANQENSNEQAANLDSTQSEENSQDQDLIPEEVPSDSQEVPQDE